MAIDIWRARRALSSSGGRSASLVWPFGRERRARLLLRRRLAVVEAKNAVAEFLFQTQKALADLRLSTVADVERALADPEKRRLVVGRSVSLRMLEEELSRRAGAELGRSLDQALSELIAGGFVLQVPGKALLIREEVYIAVLSKPQPRDDPSELSRLVRQGTTYGAELRERARRHDSTTVGRSYRL